MSTSVEHDDTQLVQNNRIINVNGTHTETIVKDTTIEITEGNETITLDKGNQSTTATLGKISITAMQSITLTVGPSVIELTPEGITIDAPMITISGETAVIIESAAIEITGDITLINCG
jgi:type VI secretion system secreted protein VgrG